MYEHSSKNRHVSLMSLMDMDITPRSKFWDEQSSLAEEISSKKRRVVPTTTDENPATKALEQFLLYAADETQSSMALPLVYDFVPTDSDDSSSCSSKSSCSQVYKSKSNYAGRNMHDITRGMSAISHH